MLAQILWHVAGVVTTLTSTDQVGSADSTITDVTVTRLTPTDTVGTGGTITTFTSTDATVTRLGPTDTVGTGVHLPLLQ